MLSCQWVYRVCRIIEIEWQTALCFAQGCFHILGFHFYFLESSNVKALVDWIHLKWHPLFGKLLLNLQIDTLCSQHDYSWVPLVPETIGPMDQSSLNVFSMANALAFGIFSKTLLAFGFGLNKLSSINFWMKFDFFYPPVSG